MSDSVMRVLMGSRFIVARGGQEPTVHELAQQYYRSLGADAADQKKWAKMYVETASTVLARQFPVQDRRIIGSKQRIALMETEAGLMAKAKEIADGMFQDMLDAMAEKVRKDWDEK